MKLLFERYWNIFLTRKILTEIGRLEFYLIQTDVRFFLLLQQHLYKNLFLAFLPSFSTFEHRDINQHLERKISRFVTIHKIPRLHKSYNSSSEKFLIKHDLSHDWGSINFPRKIASNNSQTRSPGSLWSTVADRTTSRNKRCSSSSSLRRLWNRSTRRRTKEVERLEERIDLRVVRSRLLYNRPLLHDVDPSAGLATYLEPRSRLRPRYRAVSRVHLLRARASAHWSRRIAALRKGPCGGRNLCTINTVNHSPRTLHSLCLYTIGYSRFWVV